MDRKPKPKSGPSLRATLERIADGCTDVDEQAAARYAAADSIDHTDVAALARSGSPLKRKAARLRAAAMLAGMDAKADGAS